MKTEPDVDKSAIARELNQEYGINAEKLIFVPKGMVASSYIVHCSGGDRYFLKLFGDSRLARTSIQRADFYLPLTWNLHWKKLLPNVPYPIKTKNDEFMARIGHQTSILTNFINGEVLGIEEPLPDEILAQLAGLVGILHRSTPEIGIEFTNVEHFGIPFENELLDGLNALERITEADNQGKQELKELWLKDIPTLKYIMDVVDKVLDRMFSGRQTINGLGMQVVVGGPEYMPEWVSEFKRLHNFWYYLR